VEFLLLEFLFSNHIRYHIRQRAYALSLSLLSLLFFQLYCIKIVNL